MNFTSVIRERAEKTARKFPDLLETAKMALLSENKHSMERCRVMVFLQHLKMYFGGKIHGKEYASGTTH